MRGKHPNTVKALKKHAFKPGVSGNPRGKKPGTKEGVRARLLRMLQKKAPEDVVEALRDEFGKGFLKNPVCADAVAAVVVIGAMRGDTNLIRVLLEQTELPLPIQMEQDITMSGEMNTTMRIILPPKDPPEDDDC